MAIVNFMRCVSGGFLNSPNTFKPKLESLRGVAACLVLLFHSPFNFSSTESNFISNGYLFVDFFFMLSGYIMFLVYGRRILDGLSFSVFLSARIARLYPLHLFMLFVWFVYVALGFIVHQIYGFGFGFSVRNNFWSFLSHIFLVNSLGFFNFLSWNIPAWSISVELYACCMFYWLVRCLNTILFWTVSVVLVFFSYIFVFSLDNSDLLDVTYDFGFVRCLGAFYIGVILFKLSECAYVFCVGRCLYYFELFCICMVFFCVYFAKGSILYSSLSILSFALCIFVFSSENSGFLGRLLLHKTFRSVGLWSYSIYLIHYIFIDIARTVFRDVFLYDLSSGLGWLSVLVNSALMIGVIFISKIVYVLVEDKYRRQLKGSLRFNF